MAREKSIELFFELFSSEHSIKGIENATALVEVEKRGGTLVVIGEANLEARFVVVFALNERGSANVADSFFLRLHRDDVVGGAAFGADSPGRNPANELLIGAADVDHEVDLAVNLLADLRPSFRLGDRAREAIEKIAFGAIGFGERSLTRAQVSSSLTRSPRLTIALIWLPELAPARHGLTEHVAGRDMWGI
jgi:hypothetical protein